MGGHTLAKARDRLGRSAAVLAHVVDPQMATVSTTWVLAVERLPPPARVLLEVLALFGPEEIPVDLLFREPVDDVSADLSAFWEDPDALDDALGALHRVCLVDRPDGRVVVHRLVQRVTAERLDAAAGEHRRQDTRRLLRAAMPDPRDPVGWPAWRRLEPHVEGVAGEDEVSGALLGGLAFFLRSQAEYQRALDLERRALVVTERVLGAEHPDTAICLGNLAETLSSLGDPAGARPLQERALGITERVLGAEHPDTARCLGNLASTLSALGDPAGARPLEERALGITERVLGAEHPDTAIRLGNLAVTEWKMGERDAARARMERAVRVFARVLGEEHPSTVHYARMLAMMSGKLAPG